MAVRGSIVWKYGEHERQRIRVYDYNQLSKETPIVFIHGGAWRDPNNTDKDADELAAMIPTSIPFLSIDYRLSPEVKHPAHEQDVTAALRYIYTKLDLGAKNKKPVKLVGHSAGASLALSVFNSLNLWADDVVLLDGIYDLKELVIEYPSYQGFVDEAFTDYASVSFFKNKDFIKPLHIHLIQSHHDELLSKRQTNWMIREFEKANVQYSVYFGDFGKHEEVYRNAKVARYIRSLYPSLDYKDPYYERQ